MKREFLEGLDLGEGAKAKAAEWESGYNTDTQKGKNSCNFTVCMLK